MTILIDPEESETKLLLQYTGDLSGKRLLEIGSGEGRLTWRFAHLAGSVVGLEPNADKHAKSLADFPPELKDRVSLLNQRLEEYAAASPDHGFDLALLSWSL